MVGIRRSTRTPGVSAGTSSIVAPSSCRISSAVRAMQM